MDSQIQSEHSRVKELQYELLCKEKNISISYDGGSLKGGQSVYTIHATLPDGQVFFLHGENGQGVSHTGAWLAGVVLGVCHRLRCISFYSNLLGRLLTTSVVVRLSPPSLPMVQETPVYPERSLLKLFQQHLTCRIHLIS